ncbi:winged helix-turn-helix transcriptional regulator [Sphingomonas nostoxanthinifaciens]|uniref:winged helix-turn-helix transcriptional regulator n=1 Tax=Sphingomonas nostoxanthinifaciens TaxID=2872652 RepID=UPI001CC200EF|nr:helix-turn-helix domain-containing protein [Sphingomonas nostoxanthinifaciens]UAK25237.1 helix-turn-helix transcriptional regulator [Sphingomonas nostoxanthinifaciens]
MLERTSTRIADRIERGDVFEPHCPSRGNLKHVTSSWGVLTLIALRPGTLRFSELRRRVNGVSERMLAQTLQQLEGDGIVLRKSYPVVPPHVEYTLTELGQEAASHVEALADWIEDRLTDLLERRSGAGGDAPPDAKAAAAS